MKSLSFTALLVVANFVTGCSEEPPKHDSKTPPKEVKTIAKDVKTDKTSNAGAGDQEKFSIDITTVPNDGSGGEFPREEIAGSTEGPDIAKYKVVIYAETDKWYVQPYANNALTAVNDNGEWSATIALGHNYAAILVKPSYDASATLTDLPAVGGNVLAVVQKTHKKPRRARIVRARLTGLGGLMPTISWL